MIKLYGVARSRATRNIWLLKELGLPYEHVPVIQADRLHDPLAKDAPLNTLSPEFRTLSPTGTIPTLHDGGMSLSESVAINLYLAKTYGGDLGPDTPAEEAQMLQWGFYGVTALEPAAIEIFYVYANARSKSKEGETQLAVSSETLRRPLKVLEDHLAKERFMVGGRFTVADINMAEIVRYAAMDKKLISGFRAVEMWLKSAHERPAFKAMWQTRLAEPE